VVGNRIDALEDFRKQLEGADVDLLREMVKIFCEQLMGADADALCGADYGERSPERVNRRNGYRNGPGTHVRAPSRWPSPSCEKGPTSPSGCSNHAGGPSGRSSRS